MESLLSYDYLIFEYINHLVLPASLNQLLIFWRNPVFWAPLYVFIIAYFFFNFGNKAWYLVLFSLLVFATADIFSSQIIKKNVQRLRPCRTEYVVKAQARVRCGSGYSFTSSHATNHFALATFWVLILGGRVRFFRWFLVVWATIVCLAQVYVGVHYPSDVIAGAFLGTGIGFLWYTITSKFPPTKAEQTT